jgi:Ca2+-binding EF-hand superfamily protein
LYQPINMFGFVSKFLSDPAKLEGIVTQAFGMFDTDKSGFIEAGEIDAVVGKVFSLAGGASPSTEQVPKRLHALPATAA